MDEDTRPDEVAQHIEREVEAMGTIARVLAPLDPFAIRRVLTWASARFDKDIRESDLIYNANRFAEIVQRDAADFRAARQGQEAGR